MVKYICIVIAAFVVAIIAVIWNVRTDRRTKRAVSGKKLYVPEKVLKVKGITPEEAAEILGPWRIELIVGGSSAGSDFYIDFEDPEEDDLSTLAAAINGGRYNTIFDVRDYVASWPYQLAKAQAKGLAAQPT